MVKLECDRSGWTLYRDPKTGEDVDLSADVDREVAERVAAESHHIRIVEEPEDEDEAEDKDPKCGYNGCSRSVSDPDERCWQHPYESE